MRRFWVWLGLAVLLIGACGEPEEAAVTATSVEATTSTDPSATTEPTATTSTGPTTAQPTTETTGMDPTPPTDDDLARTAQMSVDDLASRLSVDADTISVVEERAVTWPDGSLGCPQLEGPHPEGEVDGYQVILEHESRIYIYHSAAGGDPFLCPSEDKDGGHEFVPPPGIDD